MSREFMPIQVGSQLELEITRAKQDGRRGPVHVTEIPWAIIAHAQERSKINHSQSLETIASRGGFGPGEAIAVICNLPYRALKMDNQTAHYVLYHMVALFNRGQRVAEKRLALVPQ